MRRAGALLLLLLVLTGCGEDAQQRAAREETQRFLAASPDAGEYELEETSCTDAARTAIFRVEKTDLYICAVRRRDGNCDWFRVEATPNEVRIELHTREAGCFLPE